MNLQETSERNSSQSRIILALIIYYITLGLIFLGSLYPDNRVWGFNWWAYYPSIAKITLLVVGAALPLVYLRWPIKYDCVEHSLKKSKQFTLFSVLFILLSVILFILLRTKTHFLGDGYQNVARLLESPLVKYRELGESLAHITLYNLIGINEVKAAYLSYRIISIVAGFIYLVVLTITSGKLFLADRDRILFLIGMAVSGYSLLFFGYIENYSLFVLSVTIFALVGLLIVQGKVSRFWSVPLFALTVFFHVLGVTLLPALIYLLFSGSKAWVCFNSKHFLIRLTVMLILLIPVLFLFNYLREENYYFRFAFIPLFEGQFTVEGYTLFSLKHLTDFLSLLILLFPPLLLILIFARSLVSIRSSRFLLIMFLASAGAIFIFDPKLGMPRDWDLFSFTGVPLSLLFYFTILKSNLQQRSKTILSLMAITLSLLILGPRVAALNNDSVAIAHIENYMRLDHIKNRNTHFLLVEYYRKREDTLNYDRVLTRWKTIYPDQILMDSAEALKVGSRCDEAIPIYLEGLVINPTHPDLWQQLGECYIAQQMIKEAQEALHISNGLNPNNAKTINNLGSSYMYASEPDKSVKLFEQAIAIDSTLETAYYNLVIAYKMNNQFDKYESLLKKVTQFKNCPSDYHLALVIYYLNKNNLSSAEAVRQRAISSGIILPSLDSIRNNKF